MSLCDIINEIFFISDKSYLNIEIEDIYNYFILREHNNNIDYLHEYCNKK